MLTPVSITHVSSKNTILIPAFAGDDSIYFGDVTLLEEMGIFGAVDDVLTRRVNDIATKIEGVDRFDSRTGAVIKLGGNIIKLSSEGDAITEAIVMAGLSEGLHRTQTEVDDRVKIPRFIAGAKVGIRSLLITEFIDDHLPVPNFGHHAIEEFVKEKNYLRRALRYINAMRITGLSDNIDVDRWDFTWVDFLDDALTNTLWSKEFKFDPKNPSLPADYYRIDFGSFKIPKQDVRID